MKERIVKESNCKKAAGLPVFVLLFLARVLVPLAAVETAPRTAEEYLERGKAFAEQKDYEEAIAGYDRAIAMDPSCLEAYIKRGDANMGLWNYDQAIADYSHVIQVDAQNKDAYLKRGGAYQADNQAQAAWEDFVKTIQIDPEFAAGYSACGILLGAAGNNQAAVDIFTLGLQVKPADSGLLMGRVLANMNLGNTDRVLEDCRIIRKRYPNLNIAAYMYEAMAYLSLEQFDKAREVLEEGIRHIPMGAMNVFPLMIRALTAEGRSESEAIAEVKRVLRETPSADPTEEDFKEYILAMLSAADPNVDYDKSIAEQRERIAAMDKPGMVPYGGLFMYYWAREDMDGAVAEMNEAVARSPRDSALYVMRAYAGFVKAVMELGEKPREQLTPLFRDKSGAIIADCSRAISLDGNLAGAYQIRGLARKLADLPGAGEDLGEAIRLKPGEEKHWYARGWVFFDNKNYSAARKDFIQALNIDKDYQEALYGLARSCAALGDHRRAVNFYTRAISIKTDDIEALHYRGESLRALGETTLAKDDFSKVRELNTENREIREALALQLGFNFF